ncbi:cbb3-type cytochrome c oxidase subunit I [Fodinibius sediminis]|uniref:Cytochrome C and Quinol oxidase polypeptide I n=1 Tax=Fodinibius sediminis TaxID=1214077 RepID=A0A521BL75_9BACT|nr:cbb3-type cytochrome c oxidase subunit I [Fodinibius sediminis]SMO47863.1 Cytochrome C and Quinol oxidase polypeptide I [Fodinibius sediminis]
MPTVSRWMIRASLVYLLAGFIIGAAILISKAYPSYSSVWSLLPIHIEMSIFGWIIQLTMGTAYWILPRYLKGTARGNPTTARIMVIIFNAGILVNVFSFMNILPSTAIVLGRLLEVLAVILFIALHWQRAVSYNK